MAGSPGGSASPVTRNRRQRGGSRWATVEVPRWSRRRLWFSIL